MKTITMDFGIQKATFQFFGNNTDAYKKDYYLDSGVFTNEALNALYKPIFDIGEQYFKEKKNLYLIPFDFVFDTLFENAIRNGNTTIKNKNEFIRHHIDSTKIKTRKYLYDGIYESINMDSIKWNILVYEIEDFGSLFIIQDIDSTFPEENFFNHILVPCEEVES